MDIDLVIERKQFRNYKLISRGRFSATVDLDYLNKVKKSSVLILMKEESEARKFDFEKMENDYTVRALQYEYMCRLQTYLFYTEAGECTLQDKVADKSFQKHPGAIDQIFDWIKAITLGLKKLHSDDYVHLNIQASSILITSENKAKIGVFNFARHSSTVNKRCEIGVDSYHTPPECVANNSQAMYGKMIDVWCLALMTVQVLTNEYLLQKSRKMTSWPEQYAILYKVLQEKKFKKIVKKTYPKAANDQYLGAILRFAKHVLKVCPEERPHMGEFLILLMEIQFMKDIDKKLSEEKMWLKKVSLKELEHEIQEKITEPQQPNACKKIKVKYGEEFHGQMLMHENDQNVEVQHDSSHLQPILSNSSILDIADETKEKTIEEKVITPVEGFLSKRCSQKITLKEQENLKSKISEKDPTDGMMGDFQSDGFHNKRKDISSFEFEHASLHISEISTPRIKRSISENIQIGQPDTYEKGSAKNELNKNAGEDTLLVKQKKSVLHQSAKLLSDLVSTDSTGKRVIAQNEATEKESKKNHQEKNSNCIFTAKWVLQKVVSWAVDEKFYTGVMHRGSFINNLSKTLTG